MPDSFSLAGAGQRQVKGNNDYDMHRVRQQQVVLVLLNVQQKRCSGWALAHARCRGQFALGCDECSETVQLVSGDQISERLTCELNAVQPA
ncbi:hypothetical protein [Paracidovorax valerianellae]|uniref:hypothetical protein n=1 Tax=Paracidovorax valerianellae TaxID=187868 RepID=UPI001587859C|nr:hypothetical protein [Paracidovorax valerianellae]MDA8445625.1 hypothetical protein [Paracidovorax valerianellae]